LDELGGADDEADEEEDEEEEEDDDEEAEEESEPASFDELVDETRLADSAALFLTIRLIDDTEGRLS